MTALQTDSVRVLTMDALGDTLLEELEARLGLHSGKRVAGRRKNIMGSERGENELGVALRAALQDVLGTDKCYVAFDRHDPLIDRTVLDLVERIPPIVHARRDRLSEENIQVLVDSYLKTEPTMRARHAIEHDNARERARFVEDITCLNSRDLATLAGHKAENSSATAARWKKAGRVFALPWRGADLFPAFQFVEGKPRPIIAALLETLPEMSPWQTGFWFTSSNSWLDGAMPIDRLNVDDQVLAAARHEAEAIIG